MKEDKTFFVGIHTNPTCRLRRIFLGCTLFTLMVGVVTLNGFRVKMTALERELEILEIRRETHDLSSDRSQKSDEQPSYSEFASRLFSQFGSLFSGFDTTSEEFDYSRCSPFTTFKVFVHAYDHPLARALAAHPTASSLRHEACLEIKFANKKHIIFSRQSSQSNLLVINLDPLNSISATCSVMIAQSRYTKFRREMDYAIHTDVGEFNVNGWSNEAYLLPVKREIDVAYLSEEHKSTQLVDNSLDIQKISCSDKRCDVDLSLVSYCLLSSSSLFQAHLLLALHKGCIPVVMSLSQPLPFQEHLDWTLASLRFPPSSLSQIRQRIAKIPKEDFLELRRRGIVFRRRLDNAEALASSLLAAVSARMHLQLPMAPVTSTDPLFNNYENMNWYRVTSEKNTTSDSPDNYNRLQGLYSSTRWNSGRDLTFTPSTLHDVYDLPSETEYYGDSNIVRTAGSTNAREFSRGLGLNREPEQFTVMMMTYNRDEGVKDVIRKLNNCPHLNKVIVVWNNINREPSGQWPKIHVPVEFIRSSRNSVSNRFLPYDRIETEAILTIDDDMNISHDEMVYAFKVWRQNRDRVVGFFDRYHTWFGETSKYGSIETCEYSMVIGAYFIAHKEFMYEYSYNMHPAIRKLVDDTINCDDIAFNYLVSHLTRKAPMRVEKIVGHLNKKAKGGLSEKRDHYAERDECVQKLNAIYGYNPLVLSQVKAMPVFDRCLRPTRNGMH